MELTPSAHPGDQLPAPARRKRVLLWGAGSTAVSVAGFLALALFEQYNGLVGELRGDLKHFNETSVQFAQKEEVRRCRDQLKEVARETGVATADRARLEQELRASEQSRAEQARELQRVRERLAYLEGLHTGKSGRESGVGAPPGQADPHP